MDAHQFKKMVYLLSSKLQCYARTIIKNDATAEDIVQDAFVKIWNKRDDLNDVKNLEGYLSTVVKNLSLDFIRKKKEKLIDSTQTIKEEGSWDTSESIEVIDQKNLVETLIDQLPETQRLIMYMKDIQQYETEEISQLIGMSHNSIRVNLSRARAKVKSEFIKLNSYAKQSNR